MLADKRDRYREKLTHMRERLLSEVQYVADAIQQETNPAGNVSGAPVHLADVVSNAIEADVEVLDTERAMLDDITAALDRLDDGTYGKCQECDSSIGEPRLNALPFASLCIDCARSKEQGT